MDVTVSSSRGLLACRFPHGPDLRDSTDLLALDGGIGVAAAVADVCTGVPGERVVPLAPLIRLWPALPGRRSWPSSPTSVSSPSPLCSLSSPRPPQIRSPSPRPSTRSLPSKPWITSAPSAPRMVPPPSVLTVVTACPRQMATPPTGRGRRRRRRRGPPYQAAGPGGENEHAPVGAEGGVKALIIPLGTGVGHAHVDSEPCHAVMEEDVGSLGNIPPDQV